MNPMLSEDQVKQIAARVLQRVEAEQHDRQPSPWPLLSRSTDASPAADQDRKSEREIKEPAVPEEFFAPWTGESFEASGATTTYPSQLRSPAAHPSQELFTVAEAAEIKSAVSELVEFFEAQRCTIEKDKPCDHCGACRTLGF